MIVSPSTMAIAKSPTTSEATLDMSDSSVYVQRQIVTFAGMGSFGPTVPRTLLGNRLAELRETQGITLDAVARRLEMSTAKVRRIEGAEVSTTLNDLAALLDLYGVNPEEREALQELRRQGGARSYWAPFGTFSATLTRLLGLEQAANQIRMFEGGVIPGPLQTDDYARAKVLAWEPAPKAADVDRAMDLHRERRKHTLTEPKHVRAIIDESVLLRPIGDPEAMKGQLRELLEPAHQAVMIQVLPLSSGAHPAMSGGFWIFDFPPELREPLVYEDRISGNLYLERPNDVARCNRIYDVVGAMALSPQESKDRINRAIKEMT